MKKIVIILLSCILLLYIWNVEKRSFYHIGKGQYITVWKKSGGVCYIIPDKYYGLTKPTDDFLETTNDNYIVFFTSQDLPKTIIYWENKQDGVIKVQNSAKSKAIFVDYLSNKDSLHNLLYKPDAKKVTDIKENAELLDLDIKEQYAFDKTGKKM